MARRKYKSLRELFAVKRRWMRGDFSNGHGAYCLVGGIYRVYPAGDRDTVENRLLTTLRALGWDGGVVDFNDTPGRTFADIQHVVRRARV